VVIGPTGEPVSETLADREGLLYAQVDVAACVEPKQFHDVVGGYNRFDVFRLTVDRSRNRPAVFADGESGERPSPREPDEELRPPQPDGESR
jgi:nitrilase